MSVVVAQYDLFRRSVKQRPATELVCEYVFRPAALEAVGAIVLGDDAFDSIDEILGRRVGVEDFAHAEDF